MGQSVVHLLFCLLCLCVFAVYVCYDVPTCCVHVVHLFHYVLTCCSRSDVLPRHIFHRLFTCCALFVHLGLMYCARCAHFFTVCASCPYVVFMLLSHDVHILLMLCLCALFFHLASTRSSCVDHLLITLIPNAWLQAIQVCIPKEGAVSPEGHTRAAKLRPITILSTWWRVMASSMLKAPDTQAWLRRHLPGHAFGLGPSRAAHDEALLIQGAIEEGHTVAALDYKQCFDHIDPALGRRPRPYLDVAPPHGVPRWCRVS